MSFGIGILFFFAYLIKSVLEFNFQILHGAITFNLGPKNIWKDVLNEKLAYRIEKNFKKEMKELNYLS